MTPSRDARRRMVEIIAARGVVDPRVLEAMAAVPRELFVPADLAGHAYDDGPLPIEEGQTISQPYIVALMIEAAMIGPSDRVLEVGTGSGYAAAVIARLCASLVTIERHRVLADRAATRLARIGASNVTVVLGDGSRGYAKGAPFDAILVAAGAPAAPPALTDQLAIGGRLVAPIGPWPEQQTLRRLVRTTQQELTDETLCEVRFVPLVGDGGWPAG
jgi:protein-L-isoaspartate(D-aspartate) O-methyltransferase